MSKKKKSKASVVAEPKAPSLGELLSKLDEGIQEVSDSVNHSYGIVDEALTSLFNLECFVKDVEEQRDQIRALLGSPRLPEVPASEAEPKSKKRK